jgi:excisionase family DNA binding protein
MTRCLTVEQAAEYLQMGHSTANKLMRENRIPAHKARREWRFDAEELDRRLKADKTVVEIRRR